jgi:hypothetical protein
MPRGEIPVGIPLAVIIAVSKKDFIPIPNQV